MDKEELRGFILAVLLLVLLALNMDPEAWEAIKKAEPGWTQAK